MCVDDLGAAGSSAPREVVGDAVDPIRLEPVDEVVITMVMDNSFDGLLPDLGPTRRFGLARWPHVASTVMDSEQTKVGLVAEHGFSALVTTRRGDASHTVLFDTGISPRGAADNLQRLALDHSVIEAVVLSHGHFDHAGGLEGFSRLHGFARPLVVHPGVWSQRRLALPGMPAVELPTVSRNALEADGFEVIERRQPSLLLGGSLLITGEVDRTTDFETGLPHHECRRGAAWEPDPLILDDQAVVVQVRDRGLVVLTGCGHAGAVNIARHAMRLTGENGLHGLLGGFHLGGPAFEPIIDPTIAALAGMNASLVVPAHCTGWRAQHRFAAALPDAFIPNAVGTTYRISAPAVTTAAPA